MQARPRLTDVVTTPERSAAYRRAGLWDANTLAGQVAHYARTRPSQIAVVDLKGARRISYERLDRDGNRIANFLVDAGVRAGDVVAIQLPNWYETVAIGLGALKAGAVLNPMLTVYRTKELRHMLTIGETRVIFAPPTYRGFDHATLIAGVTQVLSHPVRHVAVPDPEADRAGFAAWLSALPDSDPGLAPPASFVSELIFTSGTEAEPKAIMHTEETTNFSARAAWSALGMREGDIVYMPSPIGHSTGFNYGVRVALYHGLTLVLQDRWSAADAVALIEGERCAYTLAATTFLNDIIQAGRRESRDLSSLRLFGCGGAPIPPDLVMQAKDLGMTVLRLYGSTEALVVTWNRPESSWEKRVGTDGNALDHVELEIRQGDGQRGVVGEPGEIFIRGPNTCVGFFNDPGRTQSTFEPDGWVRSGDLGVLDHDGYLTIVGRKKEIIIRGGLNIAPREIEELILKMPPVAAVAVVGLPHDRLGEIGCACVVLKAGSKLTFEELIEYLKSAGLATYKLPERLEIVDQLPVTSTGKVRKHVLVSALLDQPS